MPDSIATPVDPTLARDAIARVIADKWVTWNANRTNWLDEKKELRQYLFATDTTKTANKKLPWKNSTVTPKLTQIRDNLHANYLAALFPNDDWFIWEAEDREATDAKKKKAIRNYMKNKLKASGFELVVSQLVYDYIDYGNVIAGHEYVSLEKKDPATQEVSLIYRGPRAFRVSPLDCVMDPTASSFEASPFIRRVLKGMGDLQRDIKEKPSLGYRQDVIDKAMTLRRQMTDNIDWIKGDGLVIDGFGSIQQYFTSGMVELLEFWGDVFDTTTGTLYTDQVITVMDRMYVLRMEDNKSWTGSRPYKHCGWRLRPDNLWAQGPLDQLVGMQYRIDHLENLKADVFDQIAHPFVTIKGDTVEDFEFGPNQQVHLGTDGEVELLRPEAGALSADMEIQTLMDRMEELAGAPRQAMGIRTPGEKTKYEVQVLENGAGRIFQSKVNWFEKNILEPLLNSMLEESRRELSGVEKVRIVDPDLGAEEFVEITREDLIAKGKLFPVGARHFAEQAKFIQELTQTLTMLEQLPTVKVHISGLQVAKAIEENMGWGPYKIVRENVALIEQANTQRLMHTLEEQVQAEAAQPSELQSGDYTPPGDPNPTDQPGQPQLELPQEGKGYFPPAAKLAVERGGPPRLDRFLGTK